MAKSNNNFPGLVSKLSQGSSSRAGASQLLSSSSRNQGSSGAGLKAGSARDTKPVTLGATLRAKSIGFGKPSSNGIAPSPSGTDWTHLLTGVLSGGIASAFGGGLGFGGFGGLGSIVSGIANLFGSGKKDPAPLPQFHLPQSQDQTIYIGTQNNTAQWFQDQSAHVAQAVKTALLHSNSLGDVISDI